MLKKMCEKTWFKIQCPKKDLNLALTLSGGQSFRWKLIEGTNSPDEQWIGVLNNNVWILRQTQEHLEYRVLGDNDTMSTGVIDEQYENILVKYFRLNVDLEKHFENWKLAHTHFKETAKSFTAIRMLDQTPLENIISFICSQNNHIKRISNMVEWFCQSYGTKICDHNGSVYFTFPKLEALCNCDNLEEDLRKAKFGYRSGFIAKTIKQIQLNGGIKFLNDLKTMDYRTARNELVQLPGIGPKVADCICLMSLNHLDSVPVDTHIYKIARTYYMPDLKKTKNVTTKAYNEISDMFRKTYGKNAGWAQTILFCSDLQKFNNQIL